ncbi:hypothetical protein V2G26_016744 [Clonostachys chloroleuca]
MCWAQRAVNQDIAWESTEEAICYVSQWLYVETGWFSVGMGIARLCRRHLRTKDKNLALECQCIYLSTFNIHLEALVQCEPRGRPFAGIRNNSSAVGFLN